jgi:hypothetical protein
MTYLKRSLLTLAALMTAVGGWLIAASAPAGAAVCNPPGEVEHHVRFSNTGGPSDVCIPDFVQGTNVLYCDTDGDGADFIVWFDADTGDWFDSDTETIYHYGRPGDFPICGDWDGNGADGIGVLRGATWFLRNAASGGSANLQFNYGVLTDFPVAGDWNDDGRDTPGVVRGNTWLLRNSNSPGPANLQFAYGTSTDFPIVGDYNGDGRDTPGVVRGNTWLLRNSNSPGSANLQFGYGTSTDLPISTDIIDQGRDTPVAVRFLGVVNAEEQGAAAPNRSRER